MHGGHALLLLLSGGLGGGESAPTPTPGVEVDAATWLLLASSAVLRTPRTALVATEGGRLVDPALTTSRDR